MSLAGHLASARPAAPGDGLVRIGMRELLALRAEAQHLSLKSLSRHSVQSGGRRSQFRARGMDYEESRRYQIGDDMRNLDWRVTARTGKPYTKLYREERERPVLVCVDLGPHMFFATRGMFKSVMAARCASLLAWAALSHGDRIGGFVFGGAAESERRPARGKRGVLGLLNDIAAPGNWPDEREPRHMSLPDAVAQIARVARPGTLVVMISDFRDLNERALGLLRRIAVHSDLLNVFVSDPLEQSLPPPGRYPIADRGARWLLDSRSRANRADHEARFAERVAEVESLYGSAKARCIFVSTDDDPVLVMGQTLRGVMR